MFLQMSEFPPFIWLNNIQDHILLDQHNRPIVMRSFVVINKPKESLSFLLFK